ncbi:MAG: penicillin-binding protein 1C [Myxococcales bacterium]|nr:penicillin-binding protein 1C [Myxococcales bacterium]
MGPHAPTAGPIAGNTGVGHWRGIRTAAAGAGALALAALVGLWVSGLWRAPPDPATVLRTLYGSTRLLDRHGRALSVLTGALHTQTRAGPGGAVAAWLVRATLAAEDRRYFDHPGVDAWALLRACRQNVAAGRIVSGASTLTQQVVKLMAPRDRSVAAKAKEALQALDLDRRLGKAAVLDLYFAYAPYGPLLRGADAAARAYFAKPVADLTLAEAALLAVLPRAPSRLDPARHLERAQADQRRLLDRMEALGWATAAEVARARAQSLALAQTAPRPLPGHVADLARNRLDALPATGVVAVHTTLDAALQQDLEPLLRRHVERLGASGVSQAALVVVENASGAVRAMLGSTGWQHAAVNGALARRQPGSALKPFAYAAAFDRGWTPASLLDDAPAHFPTPQGDWLPRNYSDKWRGRVRAREALACSLNVPAVHLVDSIGIEALRTTLAALGLRSLAQSSAHYGLGLVLGDGEVTLLELAGAAATLARGGTFAMPRWIEAVDLADGESVPLPRDPPRRVFSAVAAYLATDVLADPDARAPAFGRGGPLELPFPAAGKTGTSKGFRDNWAVLWTPTWTVAAWAGNFDGSPMRDVSGVTGAAPLAHDALLRLVRGQPTPAFAVPDGLVRGRVCALSGGAATPQCPHALDEWLPRGASLPPCSQHGPVTGVARGPLRIAEPWDGAVYWLDSVRPAGDQMLALRADGGQPGVRLRWRVDAADIADVTGHERAFWSLRPGAHRIEVTDGTQSAAVRIDVEGVGPAQVTE